MRPGEGVAGCDFRFRSASRRFVMTQATFLPKQRSLSKWFAGCPVF